MFRHIFITLILTLLSFNSAQAQQIDKTKTILITGASRGIGFAFTQAYADKGWTVIATCRTPAKAEMLIDLQKKRPNVIIEAMDVTDSDEIQSLAVKYENTPIDILLNNAGIQGDFKKQKLGAIDEETFKQVMSVNTFGALKVTERFLNNIIASETKKVITISSYMGSIKNSFGMLYTYRASKAALNMVMKTLAVETKKKGVVVGMLDPGIVLTEFSTFSPPQAITAQTSVTAMMPLIESFNIENTGSFYKYDGTELAW